jgi:hypothetical protein
MFSGHIHPYIVYKNDGTVLVSEFQLLFFKKKIELSQRGPHSSKFISVLRIRLANKCSRTQTATRW